MTDIDDPIEYLRTTEQPPAAVLDAAPILDDWTVEKCVGAIERQHKARGTVSGSWRFPAAHDIVTSEITYADQSGRWIRTRNTLYKLGSKRQRVPLIVHVATRPTWLDAWRVACEATGQHTVPEWVWSAALESSRDSVGRTRRMAAAAAVGDEMYRVGRPSVGNAWALLATDAIDRTAVAGAFDMLCAAAGPNQTPEESDTIDGWGMLAQVDTDTSGIDLSDCIVAARMLGERRQKQPRTPLLLRMARSPNSVTAAKMLLAEMDVSEIVVANITTRDLVSSGTEVRREAAKLARDWRQEMGLNDHVQTCLRLLSLDPLDRVGCNLIRSKIEGCLKDLGIDPETDRVWRAWNTLAAGLVPPAYPGDAIMSAWALDMPTAIASLRGTDALRESTIDIDAPTPEETSGVIVLKAVGGTSETTSGKEAAREFKAIAGKRLRLEIAIDLADVRSTLRDEFPHLHTQIDVLLSDLTEGEPIRLRHSLLVGPAGSGKSKIARRMADCLGIGLHRYDGAGASDNAFGGTARRWSSGEHCVPLEAVRRHKIANPVVLIDEIDKAAIGRHNGNLCNSLMPFMDSETSKNFPDPFVQADIDLSNVSYVLTANDDTLLPAPLRDRLRVVRLPEPSIEHLPSLARGIVADIAKERGGDARWWPSLEDGELAIAEELWPGGSVRRLRAIVERILAWREQKPRN